MRLVYVLLSAEVTSLVFVFSFMKSLIQSEWCYVYCGLNPDLVGEVISFGRFTK